MAEALRGHIQKHQTRSETGKCLDVVNVKLVQRDSKTRVGIEDLTDGRYESASTKDVQSQSRSLHVSHKGPERWRGRY